jgi:hypothetical protein
MDAGKSLPLLFGGGGKSGSRLLWHLPYIFAWADVSGFDPPGKGAWVEYSGGVSEAAVEISDAGLGADAGLGVGVDLR